MNCVALRCTRSSSTEHNVLGTSDLLRVCNMGSHKCYVKKDSILSVHTFHSLGGTSDHSQDTVGFIHLLKNVNASFESTPDVNVTRRSLLLLLIVNTILSKQWLTLSRDTEHLSFSDVEFQC